MPNNNKKPKRTSNKTFNELKKKLNRKGVLLEKNFFKTAHKGSRYLTNRKGSKTAWSGHRSLKEVKEFLERQNS